MHPLLVRGVKGLAGMLILIGIGFLGFGRKAQRFEEATGKSVLDMAGGPVMPVALIVIGIALYVLVYLKTKKTG